jgi:peptidoglycan/LPS O-acetylase OafA/YrhL
MFVKKWMWRVLKELRPQGNSLQSVAAYASVTGVKRIPSLVALFATRWPNIPKPAFAVFVLAVIAIPMYNANTAWRTLLQLFVLNPALAAAIGGILIHVVQNPYRILNVTPVVWLGQISYSLYLWQQPFMHSAKDPSPPLRSGLLWAMAVACVSYYLVERPLLRYRDSHVPRARRHADQADDRLSGVSLV